MGQAAEATFDAWMAERPALPPLPRPRLWPGPAGAAILHGAVALILVGWAPDAEPPAVPAMVVEMVEMAEAPAPLALPEPTVAAPPPLTSAEVPPPEPEPEPPPQPEPEIAEAAPLPEPPPPKPAPKAKPRPPAEAPPRPAPQPTAAASGPPAPVAAPGATVAPPVFVPPSSTAAYLRNPKPRYPRAARMRGMEGVVLLSVQVASDGSAGAVAVKASSGFTLLDEAAVEAVRAWRFVPATRGGRPEAAAVDVPIRFSLAGAE